MSREIKFRAYIKFLGEVQMVTEMKLNGNVFVDDYFYALAQDDVCLMQYTGLKDNDKVEVYESDVVEAFGGHTVGVIVMHNGSWMIKTNEDLESLFDAYDSCDLHVIGNIHQNPELLK